MLKLLTFLTLIMVSSAAHRPLHHVVKQVQDTFNCEINFPEDIRSRKTLSKQFSSLDEALNTMFGKESFAVIARKSGTQVNVFKKTDRSVGRIANRRLAPSTVETSKGSLEIDSNTLLLNFDKSQTEEQRRQVLSKHGLTYDERAIASEAVLVAFKGKSASEMRDALAGESGLVASYNPIIRPANSNLGGITVGTAQVHTANINTSEIILSEVVIEDPLFAQQWGYQSVNAVYALDGQRVKRPKVVVLDTGATVSHPDIDSNVINRDFDDNLVTDNDENGHGTAVVGILGAAMNQQGIVGLIDTDIISIKVFDN